VELFERTLGHFEQGTDVGHVRQVLLDEERRFGELLQRGRTVLSRLRRRGPLTQDDLRYLHETHGLPPELVTGLLSDPSAPRT
ncbi:MAG: alanine--tRNA ligase-related protein, partial [Actinomycetes bacterium]